MHNHDKCISLFPADVTVEVEGYGTVTVDIGYGGAFYAILPASLVQLDVQTSATEDLVRAATAVTGK